MERPVKVRMSSEPSVRPPNLLSLPDGPIVEVLRHLDGRSLVILQRTASYCNEKHPLTRLPLVQHVARENLLGVCRSTAEAERFRCEARHHATGSAQKRPT